MTTGSPDTVRAANAAVGLLSLVYVGLTPEQQDAVLEAVEILQVVVPRLERSPFKPFDPQIPGIDYGGPDAVVIPFPTHRAGANR